MCKEKNPVENEIEEIKKEMISKIVKILEHLTLFEVQNIWAMVMEEGEKQ